MKKIKKSDETFLLALYYDKFEYLTLYSRF